MPKYNIFEEGIKDLPFIPRMRHRRGMLLTKIKLEWDNFRYNGIKNTILDWVFDTFGERDIERTIPVDGYWKEKRIWRLRIFGKNYIRDYDKDFYG
jgi:hypothetical protein